MASPSDDCELAWLEPGGGLRGPLWRSLGQRMGAAEPEHAVGRRVGPYRIVELLGRGGMALVYRAERADGAYEQQVALKLVDPQVSALAGQDLLRRERQILATLQHASIARLLDGGATDDGQLWFAMELIEGRPIDRRCAELPFEARIAVLRTVCDAVQYAHMRRLVHRDIKPSNILITDAGEVKLLDFGIAAALTGPERDTAPHALTPGHASPEQLRGESATTASDVWQLGRLLGLAAAPAPRSFAPDLAAIVGAATRPAAESRYASAAELAADLDNLLARRPVRARDGGAIYRLVRFAQRNRIASGVSMVALVSLVAMAALFAIRLTDERDRALREAERANAATQFMVGVFQVADPAINRGDLLTANDILERGAIRLQSGYENQPALRADLLASIASAHAGLGQFDRSEALFRQSIELSRNDPALPREVLAVRLRRLAQAEWRLDRYAEALALAEEAYALVAGDADQADLQVYLLNTQAVTQVLLGRPELAERTQRRALDLVDRHLTREPRIPGHVLANLGKIHEEMQHHDEAVAALRRAVAALESVGPGAAVDVLDLRVALARELNRAGHADEAWALWQAAAPEIERILPPGHLQSRTLWIARGEIELARGDPDAAREWAGRAVRDFDAGMLSEVLVAVPAREIEGRAALAQGRNSDAVAAFAAQRALLAGKLAEGHPRIALADALLGEAQCRMGDADAGRRALERALGVQAAQSWMHAAADATRAALAACGT